MDQVAKHPALAKQMSRRELPPDNHSLDSEEARVEYVKNHISTQYHLIGTAAMGEVVDDRLKVKGVSNLRVVDASIFPGHVSGVSLLYNSCLSHPDGRAEHHEHNIRRRRERVRYDQRGSWYQGPGIVVGLGGRHIYQYECKNSYPRLAIHSSSQMYIMCHSMAKEFLRGLRVATTSASSYGVSLSKPRISSSDDFLVPNKQYSIVIREDPRLRSHVLLQVWGGPMRSHMIGVATSGLCT